jgi:alkylated DNA repair dioxygenase AlkB
MPLFSTLENNFSFQEKIEGLQYFVNFISEDKERELIQIIDQQEWLSDLKRRVKHYGWKYDYKAKKITSDLRIGNLPMWLEEIAEHLYDKDIFNKIPDQVIVNEYQVGQGISAHIDCVPCFGDRIASLSLVSDAVMEFINPNTNQKVPILLEQRSLVLLSGSARYEWQHKIPARKTDKINNQITARKRRISMTFREVLL